MKHRFKLIKTEEIREIRGTARFYVHEGCGAELVHLENDDDNKVYAIGFKTYPTDDTGVAHILEHSVLSGSRKYPVKELFSTIMRRSLNTFINAMTFSDRTIYPVASRNSKDFMNLVQTYTDSVFCPNIYDDELTFRQEGWSYAFEEDGTPYFNGVVYNEMKGAMASPEERAMKYTNRLLFDNTYYYNSGGEPEEIPKLTHEKFLDFHRTFYSPSNARFFIYGDADAEAVMDFLESDYLASAERIDVPGIGDTIRASSHEWEPLYEIVSYPSADDFNIAMITAVVGDSYDRVRNSAMNNIVRTLFCQGASPFKVKLLEEGYCQDVDAYLEATRDETTLSVALYGVREKDPRAIEKKVFDELRALDFEALHDSFEATLADAIFQIKEADAGSEPKGMMFMYPMELNRDEEDVFCGLRYEERIAAMREDVAKDRLGGMLKEYVLDNPRRATVLLTADAELSARETAEERCRAIDAWNALSEEEKAREREWTEKLIAKQEAPDDPDVLAGIPGLTEQDLKETHGVRDIEVSEAAGKRLLYYEADTNGVLYLRFRFPIAGNIDPAYVGMTAEMLGDTDTAEHSYEEISRLSLSAVGSMSFDIFSMHGTTYFSASAKMLPEQLRDGLALIAEVLTTSRVGDRKRLKEVLGAVYYQQQQSIYQSGMNSARGRVMAGFDEDAAVADRSSGIGYYQVLDGLFGEEADAPLSIDFLSEALPKVLDELNDPKEITAVLTSDRDGRVALERELPAFYGALEAGARTRTAVCAGGGTVASEPDGGVNAGFAERLSEVFNYSSSEQPLREAFSIPSPVQYVAMGGMRGGGREAFSGAHIVAASVIRTYLWNEVRVKGGAYGSSATLVRDGNIVFGSYRDPNLTRTIDTFNSIADYLENIELADDELLEAKTSAIASYEPALSVKREGASAAARYAHQLTAEEWLARRQEILDTTVEEIRAVGADVRTALSEGRLCVIGSDTIIKEAADRFDSFTTL